MKTIIKLTLAFATLVLIPGFKGNHEIKNTSDMGCEIMHTGTFKYGDANDDIRVIIKGNRHIEVDVKTQHTIKSKLEWVNDCEYNVTLRHFTIPNFPYKVGDVINVKIDEVIGNEIFYTSRLKRKSWKGKLIKTN